ncbi:SDR family NAD(P)-dependent oxidoreductase [Tenacibaculum tangerinum]|uniref:SDR family NAD(P)-dependent oxidoreductase n=1 Tax=Tenacibaculum tangerinum TaxID=3038772 RepID=A0ABY8L2L9_9FLAO|nr:SDR family NAD(P)-dependent oxidoreductase [Tenacibaculum tangerinum]WGH74234.1 SDR family NAD(P)-dependent oxidoreductase [Tenacibaculum tangerinum]
MKDLRKQVAVIGYSGKFASAGSLEEYSKIIMNGERATTNFSKEAIIKEGVSEEIVSSADYKPISGYFPDVDKFDANFFKFSNREAEIMDPQFRLFLQESYHALENSGYINKTNSVKCGVFASCGMALYSGKNRNTYFKNNVEHHKEVLESVDSVKVKLLNDKDYLATLLSYTLNLRGPGLTIQTACSSSLVALSTAVKSVRYGDCDIALAGGASVHTPRKCGYQYYEGGIYSPSGKCNPFSSDSDGIIGGNGVGVVVLKRLDKALEDNDTICGVIKGVSVNNDGAKKVSFTAPSIEGQQENIENAIEDAGISSNEIGYVEAHGTGTKMGDPIEITALTNAFQSKGKNVNSQFCSLGSVKANLGHLDTSAGIAAFIKCLLLIKEKKQPLLTGYEKPNPFINLKNTPFHINKETKEWESSEKPRVCLIASLGAGGTNAHVILSEYDSTEKEKSTTKSNYFPLFISAKSEKSLKDYALLYKEYLKQDIDFREICINSILCKEHFDHRLSIPVESKENAIKKIDYFLSQKYSVNTQYYKQTKKVKQSVVVAFTGQGSQFVGMGKTFYDSFPLFKEILHTFEKLFYDKRKESLLELMFNGPEENLTLTENAQPAIFAFEFALYKLWESFGLKPKTLLGHSVGEYTAAAVSGVFTMEEGFKLIMQRASIMGGLEKNGAMAAVFLPLETLLETLSKLKLNINIAAENTEKSIVVSGHEKDILFFEKWCKEQEITIKKLKVSNAFHSYLMKPAMEQLREKWKNKKLKKPKLQLISNLTGLPATDSIATVDYWLEHLMNSVKFHKSIEYLVNKKNQIFFELGPKPVLSNFINDSFEQAETIFCSKSIHGSHDFKKAIGKCVLLGLDLNFYKIYGAKSFKKLLLPNYPFEKKSFWLPSKNNKQDQNNIFEIDWNTKSISINNREKNIETNTLWVLFGDDKNPLSIKINESLTAQKNAVIHYKTPQDKEEIQATINSLKAEQGGMETKVVFVPNKELPFTEQAFFLTTLMGQLDAELEGGKAVDFHYVFDNNTAETTTDSQKSISHALTGIVKSAQYELENLHCYITEIASLNANQEIINFIHRADSSDKKRFYERMINNNVAAPQLKNISFHENSFLLPTEIRKCMILGGLGEIGLYLAEKMLKEKTVEKIVLIGRSAPNEEIINKIEQWNKDDKKIEYYLCDITIEDEVRELINKTNGIANSLDLLIHLAGKLSDGVVKNMNYQKIKNVVSPKVTGLLNMMQVCTPKRVLFFSSVASAFGAAGQSNYAAANAFLDDYSKILRNSGIKATSISWGAWKNIGMASRGVAGKSLNEAYKITNEEAYKLMLGALNDNSHHLIINKFSDNILSEISDNKNLNEIGKQFWSSHYTGQTKKDANTTINLDGLSSHEKEVLITKEVIQEVKNVLGINENKHLQEDQSFHNLGVDSLTLIQLKNLLNKKLPVKLTIGDFYSNSSVTALALCILEKTAPIKEEVIEKEKVSEELEISDKDYLIDLLEKELFE